MASAKLLHEEGVRLPSHQMKGTSMKRKLLVAMASVALTVVSIPLLASPAQAFSNHSEVYLPSTNIRLQANAWSPTRISGGRFDWATSSKATVNGGRKAIQSIKNTATLRAEGINVTVSNSGASGGTGLSSSTSLSWTNTNSWISDLSGRGGYTGLVYRVTVNSAAFGVHQGVKKSVDVWSW